MERRAFLAVGSLATLAPLELTRLLNPVAPPPVPERITRNEIDQLLDIANVLQGWDNSHGSGGLVGELAGNCMRWAVSLLSADCPPRLRADFLAALARLGLVAGASQFDVCFYTRRLVSLSKSRSSARKRASTGTSGPRGTPSWRARRSGSATATTG